MKKSFLCLGLLFVLIALVGCASTSNDSFDAKVTFESVNGEDVAVITIVPSFKKSIWYGDGTYGYLLEVKNTSNDIIGINWSRSSVQYNGNAYTPFITGQKYINSSSPMPTTIIPVNGSVHKEMFASSQVHYTTTWSITSIPSYQTTVVICIEQGGEYSYYTFNCNGELIV